MTSIFTSTNPAARIAPATTRDESSLEVAQGDGATLDDLLEAVETLEESERIARRVFGGTHPILYAIEDFLQESRAVLRARDPPSN